MTEQGTVGVESEDEIIRQSTIPPVYYTGQHQGTIGGSRVCVYHEQAEHLVTTQRLEKLLALLEAAESWLAATDADGGYVHACRPNLHCVRAFFALRKAIEEAR